MADGQRKQITCFRGVCIKYLIVINYNAREKFPLSELNPEDGAKYSREAINWPISGSESVAGVRRRH